MLGKRILAIIIDNNIIIALFVLLGIAEMFIMNLNDIFILIYYFSLVFCIFIIVLKDVVNGRSIGKRIMKLKVISVSGGKPNIWRLILRNITFIIWPIEAILLLNNRKKIGDRIAKTDVVYAD